MKKKGLICLATLSILMLTGCSNEENKVDGGTVESTNITNISESTNETEGSEEEVKDEEPKNYNILSASDINREIAELRERTGNEDTDFIDLVDSKSEEEKPPYYHAYSNYLYLMDTMTKEDIEVVTRSFDSYVNKKGYNGIRYLDIYPSRQPVEPIRENKTFEVSSDRNYVLKVTQSSFNYDSAGNYYFGCPIVSPREVDGESYLQVYIFLYFNRDITLNELGKIKMDIDIEGNVAEDYENYVDKSILGSFNNELNEDMIINFFGVDIYTEGGEDLDWKRIEKYPLLKGGVVAYTAVIPVDNLDDYSSGQYIIKINGQEIPLLASQVESSEDYLSGVVDTGVSIYK